MRYIFFIFLVTINVFYGELLIDPSGGTTLFNDSQNHDDQVSSGRFLGFTGSFFGVSRASVDISTNGNVNFSSNTEYTNANMPTSVARINPFWSDLIIRPGDGALISDKQLPGTYYSATWQSMETFSQNNERYTFQMTWFGSSYPSNGFTFEQNDIAFSYNGVITSLPGGDVTIGLDQGNAVDFTSVNGVSNGFISNAQSSLIPTDQNAFFLFRPDNSGNYTPFIAAPLLQNSNSQIPTTSNFIVISNVQTGGVSENNVVNSLTFADGSTLNVLNTLNVSTGNLNVPAGAAIVTGVLGGTNGLNKQGSGTLTITGANTYVGQTTINEGTLQAGGANVLPSGTAVVLSNTAGAILDLNNFANTIGSLSGGGSNGGNIALGSGTLAVGNTVSTTYSGSISGIGGLIKKGTGTLILSGNNTYEGGTTINNGILSVSSDSNLGSTAGELTFDGGALEITSSFTSSRNTALVGTGTVSVAPSSLLNMTGILSGGGVLTKEGLGSLNLSGTNIYSGQTKINEGTLELSGSGTLGIEKNLLINGGSFAIATGTGTKTVNVLNGGGSEINLNDNVLEVGSGNYSGIISGQGSLKKIGIGALRLSGNNTFNGGLLLEQGILSISSDSNLGMGSVALNGGTLSPLVSMTTGKPISVSASSQIDIPNGVNLTLSGILNGASRLQKTGLGVMTLTGNSPIFTGTTDVQQGVLSVNGIIGGPVDISSGATLAGAGTVGSVENNGNISLGNSIGTLFINGDYTQTSSGFVIVEIDDDPIISDRLTISGTANLDGSIVLNPLPGIYEAGTTYTVLQANSINGQFNQLLETHPLDFNLNYLANAVQIQIAFSGAALPVDLNSLRGNAKDIADYLFSCSRIPESKDLLSLLKPLVKLPAGKFSEGLLELGPQQFGALPISNLQSSVRIGHAMNRVNEAYDNYFSNCYQSFHKIDSNLDQSIWFNPIGYYYKQNEMQDQVPFNSRTYGFTTGYNTRFFKHFIVSAGIGYAHSNLNWYQNNGDATIQSVSFSPSFGYMGKYGYAGIMVSVARSFYDVDRKINYSNIKRTAHNNHKSYDLLAGFTGALQLKFPDKFQKNLFLLPTVNLDYLNFFESGYQESGAGAIDLSVRNIHLAFLRPEVKLKLLKQFIMDTLCASPNIYVGWLRNIPLTTGDYTSRFYKQQACGKNFTVQSYHSSTDQVVLGAELLMIHKDNGSIKIGYEANIGNHYNIQEGRINFDWMF